MNIVSQNELIEISEKYYQRFKDAFPSEPGDYTPDELYREIEKCLKAGRPYQSNLPKGAKL